VEYSAFSAGGSGKVRSGCTGDEKSEDGSVMPTAVNTVNFGAIFIKKEI
jgi:hypothetical protein